jgi:hypothetical protein
MAGPASPWPPDRWEPPPGAEVLLGALTGGLLFGAIRRTELWGGLNVVPGAVVYATLGLVLFAAAGGRRCGCSRPLGTAPP